MTHTGDNNVTYTKTCKPNRSDISVQSIELVYLPEVRQTTELLEYTYPYEYFAASPSRVTAEDGIHRCVHSDTSGVDETYTYCPNCGSIACSSHIKTERLEGEPVCTGCAVTERFVPKTKYFYDEQNLEAFREEYAATPIHEKVVENKFLAGCGVVAMLLTLIALLVIGGGVIYPIAFSRWLGDELCERVVQWHVELLTRSLERFVGRAASAGECGVAAHLDGPFGGLLKRVCCWEFHDVEVLLVAVDAVS